MNLVFVLSLFVTLGTFAIYQAYIRFPVQVNIQDMDNNHVVISPLVSSGTYHVSDVTMIPYDTRVYIDVPMKCTFIDHLERTRYVSDVHMLVNVIMIHDMVPTAILGDSGGPCDDIAVDTANKLLRRVAQPNSFDFTPMPKTVDDASAPRLIYFVGLEGTGHHLWTGIMKYMNMTAPCDLLYTLFHSNKRKKSMWGNPRTTTYERSVSRASALLGNLTGINVGNLEMCEPHITGMMSYPNFEGPDKSLQRPDIVTLAHLCEHAGVNLDIVVLTRVPYEVVASTKRRGYANVKILSENLAGINAQIMSISPLYIAGCSELIRKGHLKVNKLRELRERLALPKLKEAYLATVKKTKPVVPEHQPDMHMLETLSNTLEEIAC